MVDVVTLSVSGLDTAELSGKREPAVWESAQSHIFTENVLPEVNL